MSRPVLVTILAVLQFVGAGAAAIVLLGNGTLDSELSPLDIGAAVLMAVLGATVVGSTWNGGRGGWIFQLVTAIAVAAFGAFRVVEGDLPYIVGLAVVWLALLVVPTHRTWFETAAPA
jgi:hypothetical protein